MKTPLVAILALGITALPLYAAAGRRAGVQMPDRKTVAGKPLVLNGMGVREATLLKVDVYVAGLYLERRTGDSQEVINSEQVKQITLHFVRNVDRGDITKAWREGFKKNAGRHFEMIRDEVDALNRWMTDFREGETLTFTYVPGRGTVINVKGAAQGTIEDAYFGRVVFAVFVGTPPNKGLKRGLLGK